MHTNVTVRAIDNACQSIGFARVTEYLVTSSLLKQSLSDTEFSALIFAAQKYASGRNLGDGVAKRLVSLFMETDLGREMQ